MGGRTPMLNPEAKIQVDPALFALGTEYRKRRLIAATGAPISERLHASVGRPRRREQKLKIAKRTQYIE
jgi:hypothetical protein